MITKKKILKRLQSLEEFLGVRYVNEEDRYSEHVVGEWGRTKNLDKKVNALVETLPEKVKKNLKNNLD